MVSTAAPTERNDMEPQVEQRIDWLARRHSVLSSPIRLRILTLLVQGLARTGADLVKKIPEVTRQAILTHVRTLIDVGFVFKRSDHSLVVRPEAFLVLSHDTQNVLGLTSMCS